MRALKATAEEYYQKHKQKILNAVRPARCVDSVNDCILCLALLSCPTPDERDVELMRAASFDELCMHCLLTLEASR